MSYSCESIEYFIDSLNFIEALSLRFFPTFFDYEMFGGQKFASYRMRTGYVFTMGSRLFFASSHDAAGRGYMLSKAKVRGLLNSSTWVDFSVVEGEFNPAVASGTVLQKSERLVIPVESWKSSGIHHLPNKYINMELDGEDTMFASLRFDLLDFIFLSCLRDDLTTPKRVILKGCCLACIRSTGVAHITTSFTGPYHFASSNLVVNYRCLNTADVSFPDGHD